MYLTLLNLSLYLTTYYQLGPYILIIYYQIGSYIYY